MAHLFIDSFSCEVFTLVPPRWAQRKGSISQGVNCLGRKREITLGQVGKDLGGPHRGSSNNTESPL